MRTIAFSSAALIAAASSAVAQVPTRTYTKPDVEYAEPFSQIVGIRELSNGRVMVADSRDKILQIIDFKGGTPKKIGREGSGPGEWLMLSRLLALPGDTTILPDQRNSRLLVIAPDGAPVRTISPAANPNVPAGVRLGGGGFTGARFVDAQGRLYYQETSFSFGGSGPAAMPDSNPVLRYDIRTQATDTVAYLKVPPRGPAQTQTSGGATVSMAAPLPFAPVNAWGVTPDGRVVVAHAADYHIELISGRGPGVIGPKVQYTPLPVNAAEKKAYLDEQKALAGQRRIVVNGVPTAAPPPPEPTEWPATKPPFAGNSVYTTPAGEIWIVRNRAANDLIPTVDVFNGEGRNIARVVLPKGTSLAGFGAKSVYLYRTDDDGLQYLQRYAMIGG
jgi:hypothetical protein